METVLPGFLCIGVGGGRDTASDSGGVAGTGIGWRPRMRYTGGGVGNGDTEGPLCGVGGSSSCATGERSGAVTAMGGTVTPEGRVTLLIWGFQLAKGSDGAEPNSSILRG